MFHKSEHGLYFKFWSNQKRKKRKTEYIYSESLMEILSSMGLFWWCVSHSDLRFKFCFRIFQPKVEEPGTDFEDMGSWVTYHDHHTFTQHMLLVSSNSAWWQEHVWPFWSGAVKFFKIFIPTFFCNMGSHNSYFEKISLQFIYMYLYLLGSPIPKDFTLYPPAFLYLAFEFKGSVFSLE